MSLVALAKRLAMLVPVLFGVAVVTFVLTLMIPGDPADALLPIGTPPEARAAFIRDLGLDQPPLQRFLAWAGHAMQGDFGISVKREEPAIEVVTRALANTATLGALALMLSLLGGIGLGAAIATLSGRTSRSARAAAGALNTLTIALASLPSFWFGLVLIYVFVVKLRLLPVGGVGPAFGEQSLLESARYLILPVVVTAIHPMALTARFSRTLLLELAHQDFVLMLRARGFSQARILRHQLRNIVPGIISLVGLQAGSLLGGALFAEHVFSRPGLGTAITEAIAGRDYPVVQVTLLTTGLLFALITIAVDILMQTLDPRVTAT